MTWLRDNGIVKADNSLCSGALTELVRGNALHVMEQSKTDITVPIVGTSLGGGVLINGTGVWCAAFKQVRPFPVPVMWNKDGSYRQIKVTLDCYWSGAAGSGLIQTSRVFQTCGTPRQIKTGCWARGSTTTATPPCRRH
jgi:hypothetical protein